MIQLHRPRSAQRIRYARLIAVLARHNRIGSSELHFKRWCRLSDEAERICPLYASELGRPFAACDRVSGDVDTFGVFPAEVLRTLARKEAR